VQFALVVNGGSNPTNPVPTRAVFRLGAFDTGRWHDFVLHILWSSSASTGFVEVWLDGTMVVPRTMHATLWLGEHAYLRVGYARAPSTSTGVTWTSAVYQDNFRRGDSLAAVQ
jgi:hypothetical protein